jgi:peptidoglycan/xylan/chitin deacetylase (PgdA/CDA1 family)
VAPPPRARSRPARRRSRARRRRLDLLVAGAVGAVLLALAAAAGARAVLAPRLSLDGAAAGAHIGTAALGTLRFSANGGSDALRSQRWRLDGADVTGRVATEAGRLVLRPGALHDGAHTLEVEATRDGLLGSTTVKRLEFVVDTVPPAVRFARPPAVARAQPLVAAGVARDATRLVVAGHDVALDRGRFTVRVPAPVPASLRVSAVDEAGNEAARTLKVALIPRRPAVPVRAVHVTAYGWADPTLRSGIMALIEQRRINAVELDLKDEAGLVGFRSHVRLARRIGAEQHVYDLAAAVRLLHRKGIRVIGRVVCFRDPVLAAWAWQHGRREQVVQTPAGGPYAGYGGFTNVADSAVRRYNVDIGRAGARAGVDDVLYDYVRRPDGPASSMVFPRLRGTPETAIVGFLRETRRALAPYGTYLGASVFGVAATRPGEVAQDIPRMARQVDYVAPMVYPSHWTHGEYGVADPNGEPYEIVRRSLADFRRDTTGTGARVVPWLQDFSLGRAYGPAEVRAQIDAAAAVGMSEFILWDPGVTYTADALRTDAPTSTRGLARAAAQAAAPAPKPAARREPAPTPADPVAAGLPPNEVGVVPVVMHHEIRPDRVGPYDQTPEEFRAELEGLWRDGYVPVRAVDLVERRLDRVPAGRTPVVLTFDDATRYQFSYRGGRIDPTTAIGVMLAFARSHPGFHPAGTFYVLREPFAGTPRGPRMLRWLVAHGFELGNHTYDHLPLQTLDDGQVQKEIVRGRDVIVRAVPGYPVRTLALPLGSMPHTESLALHGRWDGRSYRHEGVFLVGAGPAPSPYSRDWQPGAIPRIRSSHLPGDGSSDLTWAYWQRELERNPGSRYVSDGDPSKVTVAAGSAGRLAPRFRGLGETPS